jgi:hypothetical protein
VGGPTDDEIEAKPASTCTQPPQRAARIRRLRTPGKRSRAAAHEAICRVSEASTVIKFVDSLAETLESLGCLTVFVYLDGKPSAALDRAIAREADPGWLDWLIATLRDADGPPVLDRPSLERFLERRRESAIRLLSKPGRPWTLRVIHDAVERSPEDVLTAVRGALREGSR